MATNERKIKDTGAPGAAGRSVSEYTLRGPYNPSRNWRSARAREQMLRSEPYELTLAMPYMPPNHVRRFPPAPGAPNVGPGAAGRSVNEYNANGSLISNSDRLRAKIDDSPTEYILAMPYMPPNHVRRFPPAPGAPNVGPGAAGRSVSEYTLRGPYNPSRKWDMARARERMLLSDGSITLGMRYIPEPGERITSNYNPVGTQRRGNASYRPNKRDVLGNSGWA